MRLSAERFASDTCRCECIDTKGRLASGVQEIQNKTSMAVIKTVANLNSYLIRMSNKNLKVKVINRKSKEKINVITVFKLNYFNLKNKFVYLMCNLIAFFIVVCCFCRQNYS